MEIKIIERSAFTVVGMKVRSKNENNEIPQAWQALELREDEVEHNRVDNTRGYGICANMDMDSGVFDYVAGFEVRSAEGAPAGMVAFEVPGGRYAVFTTTLPKIGETLQNAHRTWLPQAGHRPTGGPQFELYDEFDTEDPNSAFDLHIPIQ